MREYTSPSGKYTLKVESKSNGEGYWNSTVGTVTSRSNVLFEVERNYSQFPFLFIEDHPDTGDDYLVCGSDYQGQTVLNLSSGDRKDTLSEGGDEGVGFCWGGYEFDRGTRLLVVSGCYWACPWEYKIFDFSDPFDFKCAVDDKEHGFDDYHTRIRITPEGVIEARTIDCDSEEYDEEDDDDTPYDFDTSKIPFHEERHFTKNDNNKWELCHHWVSDELIAKRKAYAEAVEKQKAEWEHYKKTDEYFLALKSGMEDPIFSTKREYYLKGQCYQGWHPTYEGTDTRICVHLACKQKTEKYEDLSIDIEYGVKEAPILIKTSLDGKFRENKWFERSLTNMEAALAYAKGLLEGSTPLNPEENHDR